MLNCQKATERISRARDGQLPMRERALLRLHVTFCRGCANFERQVSVIAEAAKRFARPPDG